MLLIDLYDSNSFIFKIAI